MTFHSVNVSSQMLQRFLCKCPLLETINLIGSPQGIDFAAEGTKFTFVDLLKCVPLIKTLDVTKGYAKFLCADGMPNMLPTSLVHLEYLYLDVCLMEENEISSALCIIRSSPVLEELIILMYDNDKLPVRQTPTNFLDPEDYSEGICETHYGQVTCAREGANQA
ncbi:hypothetical protein SSX86_027773 [Deinandra increscens subsp. villosa]|uniref:Uncharacterized protein n=1 Tax=Deinandra increscens subsp. villosa TaxID=3103831 RepID=A0AAP0GJR7_9ASTR